MYHIMTSRNRTHDTKRLHLRSIIHSDVEVQEKRSIKFVREKLLQQFWGSNLFAIGAKLAIDTCEAKRASSNPDPYLS